MAADDERYDRWAARRELVGHSLRSSVAGVRRARRQRADPGPGINTVSYGRGSGLSMGEVGVLLETAYDALDIPVARYEISVKPVEPAEGVVPVAEERRVFPATVALTQASHVPTALVQLPRVFSPRRFRASVVHWELPVVPLVQRVAPALLDEVWTTSEFVRTAYAAVSRRPVRVVPLPVLPPAGRPGAVRELLGLRDEFLVAYQFDLASSGERKNPVAALEAFRRAFPRPAPDVKLLLKGVHGSASPDIWAELARGAADRPDVVLVDDYWPVEAIQSFFHDIDCYLSLHRAEGFGLTLAQAMAAGKPVVATAYSGNLDFMTEDTSVLVPARTVRVGPDPVYPADGTWADPDLDVAADALRALATDRPAAAALGAAAREHVLTTRTTAACADWLRRHVPGLA